MLAHLPISCVIFETAEQKAFRIMKSVRLLQIYLKFPNLDSVETIGYVLQEGSLWLKITMLHVSRVNPNTACDLEPRDLCIYLYVSQSPRKFRLPVKL